MTSLCDHIFACFNCAACLILMLSVLVSDTRITEIIKEYTDSDSFIDALRCQQGLYRCSVIEINISL